jgi:hypothetical protein
MIYRGPGFRSYDLDPPPLPAPSPVIKLSIFFSVLVCQRLNLLTGEGGRRGAKSYDHKKPGSLLTIQYSLVVRYRGPRDLNLEQTGLGANTAFGGNRLGSLATID